MKSLSIGIIGCGNVSETHLSNLRSLPQYRVSVVADIAESVARKLAEEYGIRSWTTDYRQALADPQVEAVLVLTPPVNHAEIATAAMRAGKHVFCEKPLAKTSGQCREIAHAVHETGKVFLLGYPMRHSPDARNLLEVIQSG